MQPPLTSVTDVIRTCYGVFSHVFGVNDFNDVDTDFVRRIVLPEINMADKKSIASEKQDAHARKV